MREKILDWCGFGTGGQSFAGHGHSHGGHDHGEGGHGEGGHGEGGKAREARSSTAKDVEALIPAMLHGIFDGGAKAA